MQVFVYRPGRPVLRNVSFTAPAGATVALVGHNPGVETIVEAFERAWRFIAIAGLVWLAGRVYRVGMLMYGKRATLPEVWKWIRQA